MPKDTGKKLADMLYGQNPEQAAFGVYPQMKGRRSKQDPEAAKNVPVDLLRGAVSGVLGAPGDIESLIRLLPGLDERTILPTSEDIEKRLPLKSDTPVSRAATTVGQLGGGFYTGPGSPLRLAGAVPSAVKRAGQDFAKAAGQSVSPLTVWHGSPHKFPPTAKNPLGEFDSTKIGTGEGAQAYGHGHYTSEAKEVGRGYQPRSPEYEEKLIKLYNKAQSSRNYSMMEVLEDAMLHSDPEDILKRFTNPESGYTSEHAKAARDFAEWYAKNPPEVGSLYQIDLADEIIPKMLDWNAKFENQHPDVQAAILKYWSDNPSMRHYGDPTKMTGEGIYGSAKAASLGPEGGAKANLNPSNEAASMDLRHYGIPGIKYLDESHRTSNNVPEGVTNYVVFPGGEDFLNILERKKEGGPVHISDNPDVMQMELAGGGLVKGLVKAVKGAQEVLPAAEREANLAKMLEQSATKERLYHATPADFSQFKPGGNTPERSGPAIWMTPDKDFQPAAHNIRRIPDKPNYMYGSSSNMFTPGTNVMPVYSSVKNPLITNEKTWRQDFKEFGGSPWTLTPNEVQKIKGAGHDGIMYYDKDGKLQEVVAFEPQQIKSAIGNRGTYDVTDPDITKAEGGEVHMDEGGAAFGQYTSGKKYQAAKKRAEDADVNLLKDPKTYAAVQGLLGVAPDEMGFSVLHPKYQEIKEVADPAFAVGSALQVMPAARPGALALARKGERLAERVVPGIMERGGLPADILSGMAQGSASYAYRPHTPLKPDPDVGTRYKKQYVGGLAPRQDLNIEDLEKSSAKIFPWDATSRNQLITEVSDVPLTKPVLTEGGDEYMMDLQHIKDRIAGASNFEIAKRIKDRIDQAAVENQLLGGTGKVYGFPIRMGERAENFSTFPTDIAMDLMKQAGLKKKELKELTDDLRTMTFEGKPGYFKNAAPIGTPEFEQQLMEGLEKTKTDKNKSVPGFTAGNLRKGLMDRLGKVEYQKRLDYNLPDLTGAVLSDVLKGVPKGYVGNVAAELDPFTALRPSKASSYSHDFSGQYVGSMPNMPVEFLMPNTFEGYYRHFKKEYPDATPSALRNMSIGAMEKRKESISEMIGPRSVDAVKTYQEGLMKGEFDPNDIKQVYDYMRRKKLQLKLADGGEVHGLSSQDMLFLQSQDDLAKLPPQAQREYITNMGGEELRQRMAPKYADGGDITADDLILEERKL